MRKTRGGLLVSSFYTGQQSGKYNKLAQLTVPRFIRVSRDFGGTVCAIHAKIRGMEQRSPVKPLTRNAITYQKHRHEVFWQITIPLVVGALFIVAIGLTIAIGGSLAQINKLANVALISLIIPAMFFTLIAIVMTVATIYGLVKLILLLPYYSHSAQNFLLIVRIRVGRASDAVSEPFLRMHAWRASAGQLRRSLRRRPPSA